MTLPDATVSVRNVRKAYGELVAVDDLSFQAHRGEVFGLLGPNGAGKTTTLEMIEGLREPDAGTILIGGIDARRQSRQVREIIGVQLQSTSLYNKIRVGEALQLFAGYYRRHRSVDELLELVSLSDKRDSYHMNLSGGQQQRLALALALVNDPLVVFLDEPTTGLDPQARRNLWDIIRNMKSDEKTVILTTHYMEEAEQLCDRVAIMDHGRIIAEGTPRELVSGLSADSCLVFRCPSALDAARLAGLPAVTQVLRGGEEVELFSGHPQETLGALIDLTRAAGVEISDLHVRRPTLEDLFIELTGRRLRE